MQVLGRIDKKTDCVTAVLFAAHSFGDEIILGYLGKDLSCRNTRLEVFVDDDLVLSFGINVDDRD